jgi:hypothetical protein
MRASRQEADIRASVSQSRAEKSAHSARSNNRYTHLYSPREIELVYQFGEIGSTISTRNPAQFTGVALVAIAPSRGYRGAWV